MITFYSGQATLIRQLLGDVTWSWIYGGMHCALEECPALHNSTWQAGKSPSFNRDTSSNGCFVLFFRCHVSFLGVYLLAIEAIPTISSREKWAFLMDV